MQGGILPTSLAHTYNQCEQALCYIVQLITPRVPAMAVSTVISSLMISFQLIRIAVIYNFTKLR